MRIWTNATVHVRNEDGISLALVGRLTVADDFVIIGDMSSPGWTMIPMIDIALFELESTDQEAVKEEGTPAEEDKHDQFERWYQQKRKRYES